MKKQILIFLTIFSLLSSCKVLKRFNSIKPTFAVFNDTILSKLYISSDNIDYISKKELESLMKVKIQAGNEKILNGDSIKYIKNNISYKYTLSIYSKNLIKHNSENEQHWNEYNENSITYKNDDYFFNIKGDEIISQKISFSPFNYSGKTLVFIGNAKAQKFIKKSITGQPYLWGYQIGNFTKEDWIYMQLPHNCRSSDDENYWEPIYIVNDLLNNISSVHIQMSLGLRKDESKGDANATLTDLNLRIFDSKEDAMFYIKNIFNRN